MNKRLSRWVAWVLFIVSLFSTVTWSSAEESTQSGSVGSVEATIAPDVDLMQYKTLTVGYKGPEVAALKQRMYELGYYRTNTVNELYTANTAEYVEKFEQINGLPVDGIADPEMQALFFSDKARKADGTQVVVTKVDPKNEEASEVTAKVTIESEDILSGSEEEKLIDTRFKRFLEGQGEFSDKKLKGKMYFSYVRGIIDLGLCGLRDNGRDYAVQGVLLGHFEFVEKNFVAMGVKNKEGKRVIVLTQWLVEERIAAYPSGAMAEEMDKKSNSYEYAIKKHSSKSEAISFLDTKIGEVVLFHFYNGDYSFDSTLYEEIYKFYIRYVIPRRDTNINFVSGLFVNSDSRRFQLSNARFLDNFDNVLESGVVNYTSVVNELNNKTDIEFPLLDYIGYRR